MTFDWDPTRYLLHAEERARPFLDLLARVCAERPNTVVDLGCGPGGLTRLLAQRWPAADVLGLDSSPQMVAEATHLSTPRLRFDVGDLRDWRVERPVDVLVCNATLQWVPGHLDLLPSLVAQVAPDGWFALQVPGNFTEPSHTLLRDLSGDQRFAPHLEGVAVPEAHGPATYLEALLGLGCRVDAWETTYSHLLTGEDPVFTWVSGTAARPVLAALPDGLREEFAATYRRLLRGAYPPGPHGTLLPFRRVFAVAQRPGTPGPPPQQG